MPAGLESAELAASVAAEPQGGRDGMGRRKGHGGFVEKKQAKTNDSLSVHSASERCFSHTPVVHSCCV